MTIKDHTLIGNAISLELREAETQTTRITVMYVADRIAEALEKENPRSFDRYKFKQACGMYNDAPLGYPSNPGIDESE